MRLSYLVAAVVATAVGLFGVPGKAVADAITIGNVTVETNPHGRIYLAGKGTFSTNPGNGVVGIKMIVKKVSDATVVSTTPGIIPADTTEWASNSELTIMQGVTYNVIAELTTRNAAGVVTVTTSQNTWTITP